MNNGNIIAVEERKRKLFIMKFKVIKKYIYIYTYIDSRKHCNYRTTRTEKL